LPGVNVPVQFQVFELHTISIKVFNEYAIEELKGTQLDPWFDENNYED